MNSTRIISFTFCLGLACLLLTGNAVAQSTSADDLSYAREAGAADVLYTIPAGNLITHTMSVLRVSGGSGNFFVRITLDGGAVFDGSSLPAVGDLTQTGGLPGASVTVTLPVPPSDGDTFVDYQVAVTQSFTTFPSFTLATPTWVIQDVSNTLGGGGTISATIATRDSNNGTPIGSDGDGWLLGGFGVTQGALEVLVPTTATIDVATARTELLATGGDTAVDDNGATVSYEPTTPGVLAPGGGVYAMAATDFIDLVVTGDLSGISAITWAPTGTRVTTFITAADVTAGSATVSISGTHAALVAVNTAVGVEIKVDGTSTLAPRTLQIAANLRLVTAPSLAANNRELDGAQNLTVWSLNGTVLIAGFVNGNTDIFSSRIYLWNSSSNAGDIVVRVYTLPLTGSSTLMATVNLGSLPGLSGRNIRVAEDVLTPGLITLPYTADGGNLVFEVTVEASNVSGNAQVFQLDLSSFGIYTLNVL